MNTARELLKWSHEIEKKELSTSARWRLKAYQGYLKEVIESNHWGLIYTSQSIKVYLHRIEREGNGL